MLKRPWWRAALVILSPVIGLYAYYGYYQLAAHHLRVDEHYSYGASNAYKHAIAAADLYQLLATLTQSPATASDAVLTLGLFNERLEQHMRSEAGRDTTDEIAKDLYNNYVAILVAAAPEHPKGTLRTRVRALVDQKILLATADKVTMDQHKRAGHDVDAAWQWFETERPGIKARVTQALGH